MSGTTPAGTRSETPVSGDLWQNAERLAAILRTLPDAVWSVAADGFQVLYLSPAAEEIYQRPVADFLANPVLFLEAVHSDDRASVEAALATLGTRGRVDVEYRILRPDGTVRWVHSRGWAARSREEGPARIDGILTDVTERKRFEASLRESALRIEREEERLRTVVANVPLVLWAVDGDGIFTLSTGKGLDSLGLVPGEVVGRSVFDVYREVPEIPSRVARVLAGETLEWVAEAGSRVFQAWATPRRDEEGKPAGAIGVAWDVTDRHRAEEALRQSEERFRFEALHDPLTRLPNRVYFLEQLRRSLARARRRDESQAGVLFLDLDRFKTVNDGLGHAAGDALLEVVAQRLETILRPGDTVGRLGGDEFAVLLDGVRSPGEATRVADRIQREVAEPILVNGHVIVTTVSIGVALSETGYREPEEMLRDADIALYRAKEKGRARTEVFDEVMQAETVAAMEMESDLRLAVARGELRLAYQPILSVAGNRVVGVEALLRWLHPAHGVLLPRRFLPLAEETGLIVPVGEWVLRTAVRQLAAWREEGLSPGRLSVNVSDRELESPRYPELVAEVLEASGIPTVGLELELTEGAAMREAGRLDASLLSLRDLGVRLALDDFGRGYSWMGRLRRLSVDTLKIDGSFLRNVPSDPEGAALVTAAVDMAHALGLRVVAEGVETKAQLGFLAALGCDEYQGNLASPPVGPEEVAALRGLRRRST